MLEQIKDKNLWESFYEYKKSCERPEDAEVNELRAFIDNRRYLFYAEKISRGEGFSHPEKKLINKTQANKKRTVYVFPMEEGFVLKFTSFLLKEYDHIFAPNLYSFRKNGTVKKAIYRILRTKNIDEKYAYKVDISSYFNSVDVERLLPMLEETLHNDGEMLGFLKRILLDEYVVCDGKLIREDKGIIPGAPISAFLANLFLSELDYLFYDKHITYARYSDDIIVFADTRQELDEYVNTIKGFLYKKGLTVNAEKEIYYSPHEKWEFLGFSYCDGVIDVGDVALKKLKAKMKRKVNALIRWKTRKRLPNIYAARAFVKRFNAKLYDNPVLNELTWARWYFPVINTAKSLKILDEYMQSCIRLLATERKTKKKYDFRYEDIKKLGYRSLVNEYYKRSDAEE